MKTCRNCDTSLTGRQRLWCSSRCEKAYELRHDPEPIRATKRAYYANVRGPKLKRLRVRRPYRSDRLDPAEKRRRRQARDARRWNEVGRFTWVSRATPRIELPTPYHGHMWLDMAREAAGEVTMPVGTELRHFREDDIGEALVAVLEGRDPREAVRAYRRAEFIPRHLTSHFGDFREREDAWRLDRIIPEVPSAEDEAVARETAREVLDKTPYHGGQGKALMGRSRQGSPSNRRSNNR